MNIANDHIAQFHYVLKDDTGAVLESSHGGTPMTYLHGHRNIIPGLEDAMSGKTAGDTFVVTIAPGKAYGERNEGLVQRVPLKRFPGSAAWRAGMVAMVQTEEGARPVRVVKLGRFMADVDFNHPMAGKTLTFEVQVVSVRAATPEERAHGHAHGEGGHQH
jgi:FKBP-type peptidyl-prolyl cis-trans isomerase SlyD